MKVLLLILAIIMLGCDLKSPSLDNEIGKNEVQLYFPSLVNDLSSSEEISFTEIDIFLFTKGILTKHYDDLVLSSSNTLSISVDRLDGAKLYFLADPANIVDLGILTINQSSEVDFLEKITRGTIAIGEIKPFYTAVKSLSVTSSPTLNIELKRGVARLDIKIAPNDNLVVERILVKGLNTISYVYEKNPTSYPSQSTATLTKSFQPSLSTGNHNVCYLIEQQNSNSTLEIDLVVNGLKSVIKADLPAQIKRNMVYDIFISINGANIQASIKVSDWEMGNSIDVSPDISQKSKINTNLSTIPTYVRISKTLDTLFIPSCKSTFKIQLTTTAESDISFEGEGIVVTPSNSTGTDSQYLNNVYEITTKMRSQNDTESVAYLKIKNNNLVHYYGDKITFVLEESKTVYMGEMSNHIVDSETILFSDYIDGTLGTIQIPETSTMEYDGVVSEWIRFEPQTSSVPQAFKQILVQGGFKPNNMLANGTSERCSFRVRHSTGELEEYEISRVSNSLPVVNVNGTYWCKFNLRGDSKSFSDQIMDNDIAHDALFDRFKTCDDATFIRYNGDGYNGQNTIGMRLKTVEIAGTNGTTKVFRYENYSTTPTGNIGDAAATHHCPNGYQMPHSDDFKKIFRGSNSSVEFVIPASDETYTNGFGQSTSYRLYTRDNINHDGGILNTIRFYSIAAPNQEHLVLTGLGNQWSDNNYDSSHSIYATIYGGLSSWVSCNANAQYTGFRWKEHNQVTTRMIRCIKTPIAFIY